MGVAAREKPAGEAISKRGSEVPHARRWRFGRLTAESGFCLRRRYAQQAGEARAELARTAQFTFPDGYHTPAESLKCGRRPAIAVDVFAEFRRPEFDVALWSVSMAAVFVRRASGTVTRKSFLSEVCTVSPFAHLWC
jgi:hypothetical protein